MSEIIEGAVDTETPEVTELETGVEGTQEVEVTDPQEVEVTEPQDGIEEGLPKTKKEADSAFAEIRRSNEEISRTNDMLQKQIAEMKEAIEVEKMQATREQELQAYIEVAKEAGIDEEYAIQAFEEAEEEEAQENRLQQKLQSQEIENKNLKMVLFNEGVLKELQEFNPEWKNFSDLPIELVSYIGQLDDNKNFIPLLEPKKAYYAYLAEVQQTKKTPPKALGKINAVPSESEYYTNEELDSMSQEELIKNMDKVEKSWKYLAKG